ncbi:CubicO group peptidase (beta-lactamase class C family) [Arthrobacter pigmenti]|uniref:CubicO group peptidase (Beta-lactamase class C family) n=1 Tax=Arthrobacter pigmenti TaxID=271432 RepID=A0A846RN42_9MICC|nr:serine hydrolase domain-containing protein [Arthrobacter pigmenti]NJC21557.1 CubicO group peptidase (beta-lactamase class C family) [Arthrobacter pigmenti]
MGIHTLSSPEIDADLRRIVETAVHSRVTPSAVLAYSVRGTQAGPAAFGDAVAYDDDAAPLPAGQRVPATTDTVYDLASVTKIFTAVTALRLVDDGVLALDEPVRQVLPGFTGEGKALVTLRHLLTHTSGLPGVWEGWQRMPSAGRGDLLEDLLATPLAAPAGTAFNYSCVGFNTVLALAETAAGTSWADLVDRIVLQRLRALDARTATLTYSPDAAACAATECQPELGRGAVRGVVHDESACALGGSAGNAGLFGTAEGLLAFGEILRTDTASLLSDPLAQEFWSDQLPWVLGDNLEQGGPGYGHGLGLRIGQLDWMGSSGISARGHNGFTGTSLLVDRDASLTVVLLTNRVHPSRTLSEMAPLRSAVADTVYAAAAVGAEA